MCVHCALLGPQDLKAFVDVSCCAAGGGGACVRMFFIIYLEEEEDEDACLALDDNGELLLVKLISCLNEASLVLARN